MTFRQRILLDRLLAIPLCFLFDVCARVLGKLLRRDHSVQAAASREVVVCKLVGMGSIIQATPLLRALKKRFPEARLTFVTLEANMVLLGRLEHVDKVLALDDSSPIRFVLTTIGALWQLVQVPADHFLDLEVYSGFTCLLGLFSLSRNRLGFYRHSSQFKRGIYTHLVYFNTRMPIRRLYLQLSCVLGIPGDPDESLGRIQIDPEDRVRIRRKLSEIGLTPEGKYLVVNPNASDLLIERRWPKAYFVKAINLLAETGCPVILIGAPSEASYVAQIYESLTGDAKCRVFNLAGQLSLIDAIALIEAAGCVLTNDTGPMHMALSLESPMVCLFGPGDPAHYGMSRINVVTLYAPVACSPCLYEIDEPPCHGDNTCMQRISPELVVNEVLHSLNGLPAEPVRLPLVWRNFSGQPLGLVMRHVAREASDK